MVHFLNLILYIKEKEIGCFVFTHKNTLESEFGRI